ncbi:MAG: cell fate regulator YaaT (PSP1 superfamily) [Crocinitomix sp.]|jgi:cell fate regulator YaaT (PSP1 superfamily)
MGCSNCSNGGGVPNGCKSNGSCGTGSCGKLSVFDWLADVELPNGQSTYDVVELRFKSSRKGFYRNIKGINLQVGDVVAVETSPGYDIGVVSIVGELARIQVRKKTQNFKAHEARSIIRKATKEDVDKWMICREKESENMFASRRLASELGLQMKISDVEYQGDGSKATFYYTAEERVDFRMLIRSLADEFKVKIEMKQIGVRQEAARLGGIGSCGRELCCSTWLTDFRSVSTASARYQQLSLNPQKLAGQCGKLKCCLNYELDAYLEALKKFPRSDVRLKTEKGVAFHVKTDVFKEQMWYIQEDKKNPGAGGFIPLTPDRVHEIIKLNKAGEIPVDLKDFMIEVEVEVPDYTDVVGQDDLNRFEHVFKRNKKKKKKKKPSGVAQQTQNSGKPNVQGNNPNQKNRKPNPNQKKKANPNQKPNPNQKKAEDNKNPNTKPNPQKKKRPNNNPNRKKTNPEGAKTGNENTNPRSEDGETKKPNNNRNRNKNKKGPKSAKTGEENNEKKDA